MTRPHNDFMDSQIGVKHDVLDYGYLMLIDYMGDEMKAVNCARQSYGDGTTKKNDDTGLIKYLVRHHHETPLEQCAITVEMKLPMFVLGQVIRHRIASPNVMSARYSVMPDEFYVPSLERIKAQSKTNMQGSGEDLDDAKKKYLQYNLQRDNEYSHERYTHYIAEDLTRELSRGVLNQNQYTKMVLTINIRSLMNFMQLRRANDAQWEIQQYANVLCDIVKGWMPNLWDAFEDYRLNAVTLSGKQAKLFSRYSARIGVGGYDWFLNENNITDLTEDAQELGMSKGEIRETLEKFERLVG